MIVLKRTTNSKEVLREDSELLAENATNWRQVGRILLNDSLRKIAFYFIDNGTATAQILMSRLEIDEAKAYRHLRYLKRIGFIQPAIKMSRQRKGKSKGGPRPEVFKTPNATIDQVNEAQKLHSQIINPQYLYAERIGQLILEEYIEPLKIEEITSREMMNIIVGYGVNRSLIPDVVLFARKYLTEKGIKVWVS